MKEWSIRPYPNGYDFAFTLVHDSDSAYSRRLAPLFDTFDELGFKITVSTFTFWADWADNGKIWLQWKKPGDADFFAPIAVPLEDQSEAEFYGQLAARGHEIAMHSPTDTSDTRETVIRAFEYFHKIFGRYPPVYVEHSVGTNKEAQANEGSNPASPYYNTDLLNSHGSWVWIDDPEGVPDKSHPHFYDLLAANGSPFRRSALHKYGIRKAFVRTGKWREGNGEGFLQWYSEENIDSLARNRGLALVYTHLNAHWLDSQTRKIRESIEHRLRYLASKNGWFVPAGRILDRIHAISKLELSYDGRLLRIINHSRSTVDGLTIISHNGWSLGGPSEVLNPNSEQKIVIASIAPAEALSFTVSK